MKPSKELMELDLMRLLHGELPEEKARALRQRIAHDPALAEAWRRLEAGWEGLSLPPPAPVPPGFAGRVMARARAEGAERTGLSLHGAPAWVRATAAAALVAGTVLGIGVGAGVGERWPAPASTSTPDGTAAEIADAESITDESYSQDVSLAESYWEAVEGLSDEGGSSGEARP
jgi:anti-sigma factor RsiW